MKPAQGRSSRRSNQPCFNGSAPRGGVQSAETWAESWETLALVQEASPPLCLSTHPQGRSAVMTGKGLGKAETPQSWDLGL